jgi:uncharacterized protein (DUF2132 family)
MRSAVGALAHHATRADTRYTRTFDAGDMRMTNSQPNNPLHGVTLEQIVTRLEEHYGWEGLADRIRINCFASDPSVKSSLKFLRKTPWAREKVEALFIATFSANNPWQAS